MSSCRNCNCLYEEMLVLKSQLVDAKTSLQHTVESRRPPSPRMRSSTEDNESTTSARVTAARERHFAYAAPPSSSASLNFDVTPPTSAPPTDLPQHQRLKMELQHSNPQSFPFRYVPPHEFLPEPFVQAHLDWIMILDRYAQLFHAHHVPSPMITLDDPAVLRSTITLLQMKVKLQEKQVREATAAAEQLHFQLEEARQQAKHYAAMAAAAAASFNSNTSRGNLSSIAGGAGGAGSAAGSVRRHHAPEGYYVGPGNFVSASTAMATFGDEAMLGAKPKTPVPSAAEIQKSRSQPRPAASGKKHRRRAAESAAPVVEENAESDDLEEDDYNSADERLPQSPPGIRAAEVSAPTGVQHELTTLDRIERYRQQKRAQTPPAGGVVGSRRGSQDAATAAAAAAAIPAPATPTAVAPPGVVVGKAVAGASAAASSSTTSATGSKPAVASTPTASEREKPKEAWNNIMDSPDGEKKVDKQPAPASAAATPSAPASAATVKKPDIGMTSSAPAALDAYKKPSSVSTAASLFGPKSTPSPTPSANKSTTSTPPQAVAATNESKPSGGGVAGAAAMFGGAGAEPPLPPDWQETTDPKGKKYYYNKKTKETSWKRPT